MIRSKATSILAIAAGLAGATPAVAGSHHGGGIIHTYGGHQRWQNNRVQIGIPNGIYIGNGYGGYGGGYSGYNGYRGPAYNYNYNSSAGVWVRDEDNRMMLCLPQIPGRRVPSGRGFLRCRYGIDRPYRY